MLDTNVNDEIDNIMDCFAGADGGISFIRFKVMMERLKDDESEAARQIESVVKKFSKLIDAAQLYQ